MAYGDTVVLVITGLPDTGAGVIRGDVSQQATTAVIDSPNLTARTRKTGVRGSIKRPTIRGDIDRSQ